jgi:hypothetical protein
LTVNSREDFSKPQILSFTSLKSIDFENLFPQVTIIEFVQIVDFFMGRHSFSSWDGYCQFFSSSPISMKTFLSILINEIDTTLHIEILCNSSDETEVERVLAHD